MSPTRIARVTAPPVPHTNTSTVVFGGVPAPVSPRDTWLSLHRVVLGATREEQRPGLFIFAARVGGGALGRLWLAATPEPRAGTLGRHEAVDLPIAPDAALSLRHVLFVVRTVDEQVRFTALDLETAGGTHTRHGPERLTEGDGPLLLRTSGLLFFCVPTGPRPALPADPLDAWRLFDAPPKPRPSLFTELLRRPGHAVGTLTLHLGARAFPLTVDRPMLTHGVLLGRHERCDVIIPDRFCSRVHAVVLDVDGVPHLINAGSSNGTWHASKAPVKCWRLHHGDVFWLGESTVEWRLR